jgi:UDP-N-acetylglucosamine--N-acetylmuramyl-(pentapeptide) pyrophosphoryl-undecaprenol N-acetylglucosamine transferase
MTKKKILIATGGTGGHVFPACSLANNLINKDYSVEITIDNRGLQYLKKYNHFHFKKISSSPLIKKNIFTILYSFIKIFLSIIESIIILASSRPSIVFGMGGYSSFPVCIAALILRIKFIIYENNLIIGKANKYLLPFAEKIFVSNKDLEGISKKHSYKIFEIGNIVREEILNSTATINKTETFDAIKILVLGGSQAAKVFAEELPQIFAKLKNSEIPIKVYQQCHQEQNDQLAQFYKKVNIDNEIFNFSDKIIDYYSKVNLVITRSGASVLGELINVKLPFISIPLPSSADNHQYKNAEFYQKKGFGFLLDEKDIKNQLYNLINSIFKDNALIKNILFNQRQYSDKNIFKNLNIQLEKILNEKN